MKVKDLMTTKVSSVGCNDTASVAGWLMWDHDCGALPVVDESDRVIGVITDRDICMAAVTRDRGPSDIVVSEAMSKTLYSCSADDSLITAEDIMRLNQIRRLPVLDSEQRLLGILSLADVIHATNRDMGPTKKPVTDEEVIVTLADISERRDPSMKNGRDQTSS
jgi:CBS domain-containing protein